MNTEKVGEVPDLASPSFQKLTRTGETDCDSSQKVGWQLELRWKEEVKDCGTDEMMRVVGGWLGYRLGNERNKDNDKEGIERKPPGSKHIKRTRVVCLVCVVCAHDWSTILAWRNDGGGV